MNPVAWRWTNQFGKDVLSSNRELAKLMEEKGIHVEPLYTRWEDKREQQTANAVDSAPSDCTTAGPSKSAPVFKAAQQAESDPAVTLDCAGAGTDPRGPFFLTQWEREDHERRQRGEPEVGPSSSLTSKLSP